MRSKGAYLRLRELTHVRLTEKTLLSASAQCYHLTFVWRGESELTFVPGQFLSFVAEDPVGKSYTRAYSIASAPGGRVFDLCVNRVEGGFFSNYLCDMRVGATIGCHGPHGMFVLQQPLPDVLWIAGGTGIAPMRSFAQWLYSPEELLRAEQQRVTLLYESPDEDQLFYDSEFRTLAANYPGFEYLPVAGGEGWHGPLEQALNERVSRALDHEAGVGAGPYRASAQFTPKAQAYVCGLADLVKPARAQLLALGWEKQRLLFERYD